MCCRREDPDALAIDLLWHLGNLDLKLKSAEPPRKAAVSKNHRITQVGKDLKRSSSPTMT